MALGGGGFRNISVLITGNALPLQTQLRAAQAEVNRFERQVDTTNNNVNRSFMSLKGGVAAVGVAVGVALAGAIASAVPFEASMRNVNSLVHMNEGAFQSMSDKVVDMSTRLPQSANTLAKGLYDIVSSGFAGRDALTILEVSARAASAGLTDAATASHAVVSVLNAYGLSANDAADVSDVLFQTVNLGVLTFEELSTQLGDVIGMAGQAHIPIEEIGAAMATITLAGVDAAQASTSLNRVIQSLIDPSDTLRLTFKEMGFATGQQALNTLGLHGTMIKLGQAVGGNIESMMLLFPEIRAARGAMALLANEGANYNRVADGIIDKNARQGATARALAEQQKSVAFQFSVLKNEIMAAVINIGRDLLPFVAQGMDLARQAGMALVGAIREIGTAAGPGIRALGDSIQNIVGAFVSAFNSARPFLTLIGGVAIGATVVAFNGLAAALEVVTDVLDTPIIGDLAGALGTAAVAALVLRAAMGTQLVQGVIGLIGNFRYLQGSIASANATFGTSMTTWGVLARGAGAAIVSFLTNPVVIATAALGALVFVYNRLSTATDAAADAGRRQASEFAKGLDTSGFNARIVAEDTLKGKINATADEYNKMLESSTRGTNGLTDRITSVGDAIDVGKKAIQGFGEVAGKDPFGEWDIDKKKGELAGLRKELADLQERQENWRDNVKQVEIAWVAAGGSIHEVMGTLPAVFDAVAQKMGVDLSDSGEKGREAVRKVATEFTNTAAAAGFSTDNISSALKIPIDQLEEMADKTKKVRDSFFEAGDVVGAFKGATDITGKGVLDFYKMATENAQTFAGNIQKALAMGYDTSLIARLLEAGPKEAGPLLDVLVNQMDENGVRIVKEAEEALTKISEIGVQLARITQMAMRAETPEIAAHADEAAKLMIEGYRRGREGGKLTKDEATEILGDPALADQVGAEYGITFVGSVAEAVQVPVGGPTIKANTEDAKTELGSFIDKWKGISSTEAAAITKVIFDPAAGPDDVQHLKTLLGLTERQYNAIILLQGIQKARDDLNGYLDNLGLTPERKMTLMQALTGEAHLSTKEIQDAYGLTPQQLSTLFFTLGTPESIAQAGQVDSSIRNVPGYWESLFAAMGVPEGSEQARLMREAVMGVPEHWYTTFHLSAEARQVYAFAAEHGIDPNAIIGAAVRAGGAEGMILTMQGGGTIGGRGTPMVRSGRGVGVQWAEAQTGEEAYIPRLGDSARSIALLEQAAEWFNMIVVPARGMQAGGVAGEARGGPDTPEMGKEWAESIVTSAQQLGPQVRDAMQDMTQRAVPEVTAFGQRTNEQMQHSTGQMTGTVDRAMNSILATTQAVMPQVEGTMAASQLRTLGTTANTQTQQEFVMASSQLRMLGGTANTQAQQEGTIAGSMLRVVNTMTVGAATAADNFVNQLLIRVPPLTNTLATYAAQVKQYGNDYMASIGVATRFARTGALWDVADPRREQIAPDGAMRVFAERGTGGEAFIPKYGAKDPLGVLSTAASWYGMRVLPFQAGGLQLEELFFDPAGGPYAIGGHSDHVHAGAIMGQTWQMIQAFLTGNGIPAVPTSTTSGQHAAGSLHYQGRAVDYGNAVNNVWQVFNALVGLAGGVGAFASLPMPTVPGAPDFGLGVPAGGPFSGPGQAFAMAQLMQMATQTRLNAIREEQMKTMMASMGGGGFAGGSAEAKAYAQSQLAKYGWGMDQWSALETLWGHESGWNPNARNASSGAAGIPQDITGNMHGGYIGQVDWGLQYIAGRYGSPSAALAFWNSHNWYREGGVLDYYSGGFYRDPTTGKYIPRFDTYDTSGQDPYGLDQNTSFNRLDPWMGVDAGTIQRIHDNPEAALAWFNAPEENRLAMMFGGSPETWRNIIDHPDAASAWFGASEEARQALMASGGGGALGFAAGAGEFTSGTDPYSDEALAYYRGILGLVQAEDGSWVPASFYGGRRHGGLVADNGTTLSPGWNVRYNATGRPETLRPTGGGGSSVTVHVDVGGMHVSGLVDKDSSQFKKQVDDIQERTARKVAQAMKRAVAQ